MAEAWRKDEPLTTADLAGTKTRFDAEDSTPDSVQDNDQAGVYQPGAYQSGVDARPRLVRDPNRFAGDAPAAQTADVAAGQAASGQALDVPAGQTLRGSNEFAEPVSADDEPFCRDIARETSGPRAVPVTGGTTPLLSDVELTELRSRWSDIQAGFVDEPRQSVEQADQLVAAAIQRLAEGFAKERASLETQWESGSNVSTEDLRLALQRYRSFFGRLLNAA